MDDSTIWFARKIESKLQTNKSIKDMSALIVWRQLVIDFSELGNAIIRSDKEKTIDKCADVACLVLIIANNE